MENQDKNHTDEPIPKNHFTPNSRYFTILVYALAFVLGAILIYIFIGHFNVTLRLIGQIAHLLSPFITGAFIAFVLYPLVHLLYRDVFTKRFKMAVRPAKMLSILVSYLLAIGIITVLLVFIIPQIYESLSDLTQLLPVWYNNAVAFLEQFEETHTALSFIDYNILNEKIYSALPKIVDYLTGIMTNMPLTIIVSVYMISDHKIIFYHFKRLMYTIMPKQTADTTRSILRESGNIFSSFIIGKAIDSLIIGIICFVCTTIFHFPYAVLLSVIVGITNIIPYFGPYMGGVIGGVVILIVSPVKVIFWAILILIIQQFDGLYLGPKILGEKTGLRPLWVIFSITIGGSLFGVVGMFLGVPCVAVLSYILNLAIEHFLKKKNIYITPYDNTDEM